MEEITILDGGMGHQLRKMGVKIEGKIGSLERFLNVAVANVASPGLVEKAHLEFLVSGAQVITTNSYACIPNVLSEKNGIGSTNEEIKKYINALNERWYTK